MSVEFPLDVTDDEAALGYQVQEIDNPAGQAATPPVRARAVVYQPEDWERVVKVRDPHSGRVAYQRQVHGVWKPTVAGDVPTWKVVGEHSGPQAALATGARQGEPATAGSVVPSPPAMTRDHGA